MKFSVIIPVYNVEKYLSTCIESILGQNFKDFEVILVDDGSTDNSGNICDEIAQKYCDFIRVIHKENGGLSSARNAGLKVAEGEYIVFVDSDDYIDCESLSRVNSVLEKYYPDVVALYGYRFNANGDITENQQYRCGLDTVVTGKEFYRIALYQNRLLVGAPYYIYKRTFIDSSKLSFTEGLYHEDELWTPIMLYHAKTVLDFKYRNYYYRNDNEDSITRSKNNADKRVKDRILISYALAEFFDELDEEGLAPFEDNISAQYMFAVYCGGKEMQSSIERTFPILHAKTIKYILKSIIFFLSPDLAVYLRRLKQ